MTQYVPGVLLVLAAALPAQELMVEGKVDSPVRVLIYEDLQCSDCASFRRMLDGQILGRYGDKVAFVHRDFPLPKHPWARKAAIVSRFFSEKDPGIGLAYRRQTLATLGETTSENFNQKLADFAQRNGINPAEASAALDNAKYAGLVEKDYQDGVARGVSHTPTVFVNGEPFVETFTFEQIAKGIDRAIAESH